MANKKSKSAHRKSKHQAYRSSNRVYEHKLVRILRSSGGLEATRYCTKLGIAQTMLHRVIGKRPAHRQQVKSANFFYG